MKGEPNQSRRSESEIKALLQEQAQSNLTIVEFCKIHHFHKASFYYWRNKYNGNIAKSQKFIPLQLKEITTEGTLFAEIEISRKGTVRLFNKVDGPYIKSLL